MPTWRFAASIFVGIVIAHRPARAGSIPVVNFSFESPQTTFAQAGANSWMTAGPATFGAGVFLNPPPGQSGNISNAVGNQLAFISTKTGTEFSQVVAANFEPGESYLLRVGVAKSLVSPPAAGDAVRIELYNLDPSNMRQAVALTDVTNDATTGLSNSQLTYFSARTPVIQPSDASASRPIGILFTTNGAGGFLDLDNVTLTALLSADANADGAVNFQDLLILAQHYGHAGGVAAGDFNGDGSVGFDDLLILAQHYGQTDTAKWSTGDFNLDGKVDFADLLSLAQNYGQGTPTATQLAELSPAFGADVRAAFAEVPEPGLFSLLAFGSIAMRRRRR